MNITASDRELMEQDSREYWEEMQLDQHLIELWEAAQERDQAINEEVLALVGEGGNEEVF